MTIDREGVTFVAGHHGLVGSAIESHLRASGFVNLLTRTRQELDLTRQGDVEAFFAREKPRYVFLAAAKVGGIHANRSAPADFILENLEIQTNVVHAAFRAGVEKLLFLGSSCIYPKHCEQPMREEHLLTGPLEPTNLPYAIAKIAGLKLCESLNRQYGTRFIGAMPTNLYGPGDNFDPESSHVLPGMVRKFHDAKTQNGKVTLWGSGTPRREFLYVDDLAAACLHLMDHFEPPNEGPHFVNVGTGQDITIKELATLVADVVGYEGSIEWDASMPDGTPRKLLDVSRLTDLGWRPRTSFRDGIARTYAGFLEGRGRKHVSAVAQDRHPEQ